MGQAIEKKEYKFNGFTFFMHCNTKQEFKQINRCLVEDIDLTRMEYEGLSNYYETQNTFLKRRKLEELYQLRKLYVDIDGIEDFTFVFLAILDLVEVNIIPMPTEIINSGRGYHVKWVLKGNGYANTPKNLEVWNKVEKYLFEKLKHLGADKRVVDATRVLRVIGSINSKTGTVVKTIEWDGMGAEYDLYKLYNKYLPHRPKEKKIKPKTKIKPKKAAVKKMFNEFTLVTARLQDIDTILELRNYNVYDPVKNRGKRNSFLFVHLAMWINANSYKLLFKNIKEEAYQFNKQFNIPLSEKQINPVVRHFWERYKEGTPNKMSTEYIVNVLEITPEEMQHTSNLIDKNEKNDRKKIANKVNRRNEKGLTPKQQELRELYSNIINFKNEGKSNKIISELLNIPLKTLERHITKLKKSNLL